MFQLECSTCGGSPIMHRGLCASCLTAERRSAKKALKEKKKPKPIPKESAKRKKERPIYNKLAKQHLAEHPECEARLPGCDGQSVECHHSAKRGSNYLNKSTFMALCSSCHRITEQQLSAEKRRNLGLLKTVDLNRDIEKNII